MVADLDKVFSSNKTAVLLIDFQPDFCEGGALAVSGANYSDYVPKVKKFIDAVREKKNLYVVQSQDWHPAGHSSFASTHGKTPFQEVELSRMTEGDSPVKESYKQMLWPDHCIQNSEGAKLLIPSMPNEFVQQKGMKPAYDSYSAFFDDGKKSTGLVEHLKEKNIDTVVGLGLATDYCVKFSVFDAVDSGFTTYCVKDLCHGVDPTFDIVKGYAEKNVNLVTEAECLAALAVK